MGALLGATARELLWGLPFVAWEIRHWQTRALTIPDASLRMDALHSLTRKRANTDGAALFSTLASRRDGLLLRAIVAYETIWDYLDNVSERGASAGDVNGRQLHRALCEGLDHDVPLSDYYHHNPSQGDAGYLRALVETCRYCCSTLPFYSGVRELLIQEGRRSDIGAFNHELDAEHRSAALLRWAQMEFPDVRGPAWFELTAAASCSAVIHVLLALASEPECDEQWVASAYAAYFPWFSIAVTMLDSYVDQAEDAASGAHSYISHYPSSEVAVQSVREAIERSTRALRDLRDGRHHAVIAACMVAMYASKDSARTSDMRTTTASLVAAGGPLARLLVPVLRMWRVAYGQQSA
jgi:tetraprenyl-beta-curcumene synthase